MKRTLRVLLISVVVLIGIGVAGIAVLMSLDFNQYRGLIAQRIEQMTGRQLTIRGDLNLDISLNPRLRLDDVTLANAEWGSRPDMLRVSKLEAAVELLPLLSGEARITHIRISGFDLFVETDSDGSGNWLMETAVPPSTERQGAPKLPFVPVFQEVVLEDLNIAYRSGESGQSYTAGITELTMRQAKRGMPIDLAGKGMVGDAPYQFKGLVGPIMALVEGKDYPVNLKMSAFESDLGLEGIWAGGPQGRGLVFALWAKSPDIGKSVDLLATAFPDLQGVSAPSVPLDVSVSLGQAGDRLELIDLKSILGNSDLTGKGAVNLAGDRPRVEAEFKSKLLDVASLLPALQGKEDGEPKSVTVPSGDTPTRVFPDDPLPLDLLRTFDGELSFSADSIVLPGGMNIEKAAVNATVERGKMAVDPIEVEIGGGNLEGSLTLDGLGDTASLKVAISGRKLGATDLLDQFGFGGILEGGATDLDVDLNGKGATVREIMAGLNGGITIEMGEGRIHNSALDIAGADMFMQLVDALNPIAAQEKYSALSCAVVKFGIEDGMAKAEKGIAIETGKVNVVGEGAIDLKTEHIDFALKPEAREGVGFNLAGTAAGLVRVSGTLAEPGVGLDEIGAAKTAASVGAALATGGLSLLGEALMSRTSRDPNPCLTALGKAPETKPAAASKPATDPVSESPPEQPGSAVDNLGKDAKGLFKGMGKALGNIFGGKK